MFPLAHFGILLFTADVIGRFEAKYSKKNLNNELSQIKWSNGQFDFIPMVIGCLYPDIIDKILSQQFFSSGRAIGHTLVFCMITSIVILLLRSMKASISFFLATMSHLVLDSSGYIPLLWPIYPTRFKKTDNALTNLEMIFDPWTITFELIGLGFLVYLGLRYRSLIVMWANDFNCRFVSIWPIRD